nr:lytic murein transglycosylase [Halorussus pelagicus]
MPSRRDALKKTGATGAGACGSMQFMPATWDAYGVDGDGGQLPGVIDLFVYRARPEDDYYEIERRPKTMNLACPRTRPRTHPSDAYAP